MKGTRTDCFAYLIKVLITWIYMKMCRARKRRIEWLMKRQEERDREKCDQ